MIKDILILDESRLSLNPESSQTLLSLIFDSCQKCMVRYFFDTKLRKESQLVFLCILRLHQNWAFSEISSVCSFQFMLVRFIFFWVFMSHILHQMRTYCEQKLDIYREILQLDFRDYDCIFALFNQGVLLFPVFSSEVIAYNKISFRSLNWLILITVLFYFILFHRFAHFKENLV